MFSSTVRLSLHTKGGEIVLASVGRDEVIPRTPVELERGDAEVVVDVDDERFIWPVHLPFGAVPFDEVIKTQPAGDMRRYPING